MGDTKYQSTFDFLQEIDNDLTVYVDKLTEKGFTTTKTLRFLEEDDVGFAKVAHRRLILAHTRKLLDNYE